MFKILKGEIIRLNQNGLLHYNIFGRHSMKFSTFLEVLRQCQASDIQAANNLKPACEPRQSIEYLQDPNDIRQGISLIPDQISVQRCSGSCVDNNPYQSCVASQTRTRTIQVQRKAFDSFRG